MHKRSTGFASRIAALALAAAAGVAALLFGGDGPPDRTSSVTAAVDPTAFDPDQLSYQIVTRAGSTPAACRAAAPRVTNSVVAVPSLIRTGNGLLPDTSVLLAVLPTGTDSLLVDLNITRLLGSQARAQIQVIVKPTGGSSERIAFGYDGCEAGTPPVFNAAATVAEGNLELNTVATATLPALTLLASEFTVAADGTRTDSRVVNARMAPMPLTARAAVVTTGPDAYDASLHATKGTNVQLHYTLTEPDDGGTSTIDAEIRSIPGRLDVEVTPTLIDFVARTPAGQRPSELIDFIDIATTTTDPEEGEERLRAELRQVPDRATLNRPTDTRVEVDVPSGSVGSATVSYASIPANSGTEPTLVPEGDQYLVARKVHDLTVAEARVEGLRGAVIDAGDPDQGADPGTDLQTDKVPTVVEATHDPGPFVIDAHVTDRPEGSAVDVTRTVRAQVLDLPRSADVEFGAATQSFDYEGSSDIDLLTADITSTEPLVDDATAARLRIEDFPTGLTGRFDEDDERFLATVPDGAIGKIELQATSGPDLRLPDGTDGLLLEDHADAYTAFARVTGLKSVDLGWGAKVRADVQHEPGPFDVRVDIDDPDTADPTTGEPATDLDLDIAVRDLPGDALLEYTPSEETSCPASPCPKSPSKVTFDGDAAVESIDLDVISSEELIEGGDGNTGATELHGRIESIPAGNLDVVVDGANKKMSANLSSDAPEFVLEVEACSTGECGTPIETLRLPAGNPGSIDGLWLEDLENSYQLFGRITGLNELELSWAGDVAVKTSKASGPFDIVLNERKLLDQGEFDPIPYGSRTSVAIRDLPSEVDLGLTEDVASLTYHGSAPIGSVEAWHDIDPVLTDNPDGGEVLNAIVGRATQAHVRIDDLPTDVDLTTTIAAEDDESELLKATLTATQGTVGEVLVELTSDESLLDAAAVQEVPVMSTDDGLLFWDLDDGDRNKIEAIQDPYLIVARVTELRSARFEQARTGDDFRHKEMAAELDRASHRNLWVDVLEPSDEKAPRPLAGLTPSYKFEYLRFAMDEPPEKLGFDALVARQTDEEFRTLRVVTRGDGDAPSMTVETDAGSESLEARLKPVPAGATYADPGVVACVSPGNMDCQRDNRDPGAGDSPVSVSVEVAKPVRIDLVRVERDQQPNGGQTFFPEFHVHMDIEKKLQASKETDKDGCDEHFLFIDTDGNGIKGEITDYSIGGPGSGTDLDIQLPPGTLADNRWVELEGPPCRSEIVASLYGGAEQAQVMACPSGLDIVIDAFLDVDVHVEDEICPNPRTDRVEDGATGGPVVVSRSSNGGAPVQLTMHLYGGGFAPITCPQDFTQWPPCSGPEVSIGKVVNGSFQANGNFDVVSRTWHGTDHVEVVVEVDADTPVGDWAIRTENPETGSDICESRQIDGEEVPCFSVVQ